MRRRSASRKPLLFLGSGVALLILIAVALSVRHRQPEAAPPEALAHIAQKNRDAAIVAAAHQRVESAVSTNAAEGVAEAERRGEPANAALREVADNRTGAARHD